MTHPKLTLSPTARRRFILGKQGLYPGRRWRGQEGALQAIRSGSVVQIDPLNVIARSHDIALYGRVLEYRPTDLDALLYTHRAAFDYGGTVLIHPMEELPYWRVVMERQQSHSRWSVFAGEHAETMDIVRETIRQRGPLGNRDFNGGPAAPARSYRSGKITGLALYALWMTGELMTHSRKGFQRQYDLRERVAPPQLDYLASVSETEDFFALLPFRERNLLTPLVWRNGFAGVIARKVSAEESAARFDAMLQSGALVEVAVTGDKKSPYYALAEDLPLLETLQAGHLPQDWTPLETTSDEEMVVLAPLEIVSARGRASQLFDFEYLWEVYKPQSTRRWGYYTVPLLYGDRLVARFDPKLDRASETLWVQGFWLENGTLVDVPFRAALAAGLRRFMVFTGARRLQTNDSLPTEIHDLLDSLDLRE